MHINIFVVITLTIMITAIYCNIRVQLIIQKIMKKVDIPRHWSGRINVKELKKVQLITDNKIILKEAAKAIFLLKLNMYTVWAGLAVFIVLMFIL